MTLVDVSPPVLAWAQRRSGRADDEIRGKFAGWDGWLARESKPTFAQLQKVADFTHVPFGYFFLPQPPIEEPPIQDFRLGRQERGGASAELLETIYLNQRRQAWYEDYLVDAGEFERLSFPGSARGLSVELAAEMMTAALDYSVDARERFRSVDDARTHLITRFEEMGGLVVLNSMVENNTHRMLDLDEFRGFTLHSDFAPLVFVNSNDTKNGQVFSLLHEFAHVWRGESGISEGGDPFEHRTSQQERWCNAVAVEIAVPAEDLTRSFTPGVNLTDELERLSTRYRCSTLVVLLRLKDTGLLPEEGFDKAYGAEVRRLMALLASGSGGGGDFYNNQPYRVGRTLSRAIIRDTRMGRTPMTEALRLLAFKRIPMFDVYAEKLGDS